MDGKNCWGARGLLGAPGVPKDVAAAGLRCLVGVVGSPVGPPPRYGAARLPGVVVPVTVRPTVWLTVAVAGARVCVWVGADVVAWLIRLSKFWTRTAITFFSWESLAWVTAVFGRRSWSAWYHNTVSLLSAPSPPTK